jgi:glutamine synthetase
LLNEKPFALINGSGKHCNWSMQNDKGENLLDPGTTPHQNLRFLAMLAVVLKAVHAHSDALRASIASPGNDHRLGGNEAPPAIISVFLGSMLEKIYQNIEKGEASKATEAQIINLGISHIPDISKDYTDRNRTSPFAFTGNKFEFRAVGASANVAVPMTFLNAAVADTFADATVRLEKLLTTRSNRDEAVMELIRELTRESKAIRFEGNNYSLEWQQEAAKRQLPILGSTAEALGVLNTPKAVEFLVRRKILSEPEIASRYHIAVERYNKTVEIELGTLAELVGTYVVPAVEKQLARSASALEAIHVDAVKTLHKQRLNRLSMVYGEILTELAALNDCLHSMHKHEDEAKRMSALAKEALPIGRKLREAADTAEGLVADELWPLPKYREMLFSNSLT